MASTSKQFTAAAVLLLAEEGKLSLQDDVRKYVPELPDYGAKLTLEHLLTHTGGVRDSFSLYYVQGWFPWDRRQFTPSEVLRLITRQRQLNFRPGTGWSYSNSGYVLAAAIVQRVSGQPLRTFLQQRLFQPLGMKSTELRDDSRRLIADRAPGHARQGDEFVPSIPIAVQGPGGVITTAEDLLIWNHALDSGRLGRFVTEELQREAKTEDGRPLSYARGLELGRYKGVEHVGHGGGGGGGYSAHLLRFPQQRLSIAIACNTALPLPPISYRIADLYLTGTTAEVADKPSGAAVPLKPEQVANFAGVFVDDFEGLPGTLRVEGGSLKWGRYLAEPVSASHFRFPWGAIVFKSPELFEATKSTGEKLTFRRVDGPHPTAAQLAALTGHYRSDEAATTYEAGVEDKKLVLRIVDGPEFELKLNPIGPDVFETDGDIVRFVRDRRGKAEGFLFTAPRLKDLRFNRIAHRK